MGLKHVPVGVHPLERWREFVSPEHMEEGLRLAAEVRRRLDGRVVWSVNSTAAGGGVAELLHSMLSYMRGAGLDAQWMVIEGPPEFFALTKRIHNALHGVESEPISPADRDLYETVLFQNACELASLVRAGDVVLLHDPQTVGLVPHLAKLGAHVIWRCHIGHDHWTPSVRDAWRFLIPYLEPALALIFTRRAFVPEALGGRRVQIIPPSLDPFSPKNQPLPDETVLAILRHVGILEGAADPARLVFRRQDESPGRVDRSADIIRLGPASSPEVPLVVQVSRWDRLKDPLGVLHGFAVGSTQLAFREAHLVLAGPTVHAVADDPEGAEVFNEVLTAWRALPHHERRRVSLVNLPMTDLEENGAIVNALQRHAAIIVQKSLHEGFGLTVTEAMWKGRPVVASAVGGIQDQIEDGKQGLLLADPRDPVAFANALLRLLSDAELARRLGVAGQQRVRDEFLGFNSLLRFGALLQLLLVSK